MILSRCPPHAVISHHLAFTLEQPSVHLRRRAFNTLDSPWTLVERLWQPYQRHALSLLGVSCSSVLRNRHPAPTCTAPKPICEYCLVPFYLSSEFRTGMFCHFRPSPDEETLATWRFKLSQSKAGEIPKTKVLEKFSRRTILPTPTSTLQNDFSLRSCRSSSVIFFDFSQGNLENLVGNLEGIFRGFFWPTEQRLKNFGEIFGAFFARKFVARKKSFVQNSLCRRATLRMMS